MRRPPLVVLLVILLLTSGAFASQNVGKSMIIGIERYEKAMELTYVGNDVRRLAEALSDRCGYDVTMIIDSDVEDTVQSIGPATHRDALMKRIEEWIAAIEPGEDAVLFFSGHGFLGSDGKLYLAAINVDPKAPAQGGIPVEWLREKLETCPAARKLLVLDACHAGNAKGDGVGSVSSKAIAVEFAGAKRMTTLASCEGEEHSYLWPLKKQSLFTYWLVEGLQGHADKDSNGEIAFDELSEFVVTNVASVASGVLGESQNPVVVGDSTSSDPFALRIKPMTLTQLISTMADQIDTQLRCEEFPAVGVVPSFTCGETGANLNLDFGMLPAFVATKLRNELVSRGGRAYRVISENAMREALQDKGAGAADIGASKTSALLAKSVSENVPVPSLVSGRIRHRQGPIIRLSCAVIDAAYMAEVASAGGTAFLNESERAMIPDSASLLERPAPRPGRPSPAAQSGNTPEEAVQAAVPPAIAASSQHFDQQAKKPHPLSDPAFPYRVNVRVKQDDGSYASRELDFDRNDCYVTVKTNEVFGIWIENKTDKPVFLRLLVDGLNTLAQNTGFCDKGVEVEAKANDEVVTIAPRVSLEEARPWHVAPHDTNAIRGFFDDESNSDEPGKLLRREFKVVEAAASIAGRQGYTENIGLITAAFYSEKPGERKARSPGGGVRDFGTDFGEEGEEEVEHYTGEMVPGECLAVLHIRYVGSAGEKE